MKNYGCLLGVLLLISCTYDSEEDLFGEVTCDNVSLTSDIQPIIATNCAVPGCHVAGAQSPDLSKRSTIVDRASGIRILTKNRTMPPPSSGLSLTADEIEAIGCWVSSGGKAN